MTWLATVPSALSVVWTPTEPPSIRLIELLAATSFIKAALAAAAAPASGDAGLALTMVTMFCWTASGDVPGVMLGTTRLSSSVISSRSVGRARVETVLTAGLRKNRINERSPYFMALCLCVCSDRETRNGITACAFGCDASFWERGPGAQGPPEYTESIGASPDRTG